jgi:UDP-N-acetylglucosamine--N-acetylmuramyl-(pentapeptide) pyrophosphoryl-undecaprenol N-acetylglucosamine transferase
MKILLVGGGSGGPVMPLVAVAQELKKKEPKVEFLFVGTKSGPEADLVAHFDIPFKSISAGKLRRYFSLRNLLTPFETLLGFIQALRIISQFKPDLIFGAGGFVAVPLMLAGYFRGKKMVIHQQDVVPSLTNKILAPFASAITVSFEASSKDFYSDLGILRNYKKDRKIYWTGNPVREEFLVPMEQEVAREKLGLKNDRPVLLVSGGATGALAINKMLEGALPEILELMQVVHLTGRGKGIDFKHECYHPYELVSDMKPFYYASDFVLSRAGLSSISELAALKKVAVIIPMPDTHQEYNAKALDDASAALVFSQRDLDSQKLAAVLRRLMYDLELQKELSENIVKVMPSNAAQTIAEHILNLLKR